MTTRWTILLAGLTLAQPALANPTPCMAGIQDSDNDLLCDVDEVLVHGTDPLDADSDDDGMTDFEDLDAGLNPLLRDTDGDGLQDGTELGLTAGVADTAAGFQPDLDPTTTTDPHSIDADVGGVADGLEDVDRNGRVDPGECDPNDPADDFSCGLGTGSGTGTGTGTGGATGTGTGSPEDIHHEYRTRRNGPFDTGLAAIDERRPLDESAWLEGGACNHAPLHPSAAWFALILIALRRQP